MAWCALAALVSYSCCCHGDITLSLSGWGGVGGFVLVRCCVCEKEEVCVWLCLCVFTSMQMCMHGSDRPVSLCLANPSYACCSNAGLSQPAAHSIWPWMNTFCLSLPVCLSVSLSLSPWPTALLLSLSLYKNSPWPQRICWLSCQPLYNCTHWTGFRPWIACWSCTQLHFLINSNH